jgi:hypothetical protein
MYVRCSGGTVCQISRRTYIFYRKGNENQDFGIGSFLLKRIISAVKRVRSVSDKMSYIVLRGCWCHINVLHVHALTEDKIDDMDSFYKKLECVLNIFLTRHTNILLGDFNAKVGRK